MAKVSDLERRLQDAEPKASKGFTEIPSGTYQARIVNALLGKSKEKKNDQVAYKMKIVSGEHSGSTLRKWSSMGTDETLSYTLGDLTIKLGLPKPKSVPHLGELLESLVDAYVEVYVTPPGDNGRSNVYFNRLLDSADIEEKEESTDNDDDDETSTTTVNDDDDDDSDEKPKKKKKPQNEDEDEDAKPKHSKSDDDTDDDEDDDDDDDDDDTKKPTKKIPLEIKFDEESISSELQGKIAVRAGKLGFDPEDYEDDFIGLLSAMARKKGIVGVFKKAVMLYSEIKSA